MSRSVSWLCVRQSRLCSSPGTKSVRKFSSCVDFVREPRVHWIIRTGKSAVNFDVKLTRSNQIVVMFRHIYRLFDGYILLMGTLLIKGRLSAHSFHIARTLSFCDTGIIFCGCHEC